MNEMNNRVCCLYRVSTDKQVDFNSNHEADLPMQRKACHKFAEAKGWVIVHEEQEEGVVRGVGPACCGGPRPMGRPWADALLPF